MTLDLRLLQIHCAQIYAWNYDFSCEWQKPNAIIIGWWYRQGYRCPNKAKAPGLRRVTRGGSCPSTKLISLYYYMPRDCHLINLHYISVRRCSIVDTTLAYQSFRSIFSLKTFSRRAISFISARCSLESQKSAVY